MRFRYFDAEDREMTLEQLRSMNISTPAIEHIFASVVDRLEKSEKPLKEIERCASECYN